VQFGVDVRAASTGQELLRLAPMPISSATTSSPRRIAWALWRPSRCSPLLEVGGARTLDWVTSSSPDLGIAGDGGHSAGCRPWSTLDRAVDRVDSFRTA
jgi:hypothetical protein